MTQSPDDGPEAPRDWHDDVLIRPDVDGLAVVVARLFTRTVTELLARQERAEVVLTGGSIADAVHRAIAEAPTVEDVDWSRVGFWFGDERYVAADDGDRNALQARRAMLDHAPLSSSAVHEMAPASEGSDPQEAASAYAAELAELRSRRGDGALFDLLMLGIGPDGHCASLFPGQEQVLSSEDVLVVPESPKPPPVRISLGMEVLRSADEVWFLASGEQKAPAVAAATAGGDVLDVPARGPRGRACTRWFLDRAAASALG